MSHPLISIFFIILFGAAGYALYIWQGLRQSIEISKPLIEKTQSYEQHPANPAIRILVAGDSIGVGVGAKENTQSLAGRIGSDFAGADITNISVSGARLMDLEKKLDSHAGSGYDIIFITIGANDITQGTQFSEIQTALSRVLGRTQGIGKKVVVLTAGNVGLSPAFRWPFSAYVTWRTREVRNIFISEIAKQKTAIYVDLFREAKDEPFNTDIPRYYAPDHFHPSGDGYGLWYTKLRPLLQLH